MHRRLEFLKRQVDTQAEPNVVRTGEGNDNNKKKNFANNINNFLNQQNQNQNQFQQQQQQNYQQQPSSSSDEKKLAPATFVPGLKKHTVFSGVSTNKNSPKNFTSSSTDNIGVKKNTTTAVRREREVVVTSSTSSTSSQKSKNQPQKKNHQNVINEQDRLLNSQLRTNCGVINSNEKSFSRQEQSGAASMQQQQQQQQQEEDQSNSNNSSNNPSTYRYEPDDSLRRAYRLLG